MKKVASLVILSVALTGSLSTFASRTDERGPGNYPAKLPQHQQASKHTANRQNKVKRPHGEDHFTWRGHDFRKGKPVPHDFHADSYRVKDWHARGLYQPPRGQNWAYINGNYVLIAAATGIVTAILSENVSGH